MIRFRERALESFTGPEQLDQPLPLLRPGWWGLLLGLLLLAAAGLTWAIVGKVPVRVQGRGVLLRPGSLVPVPSRSTGPVQQILRREGDCVAAGRPMARIEQAEQAMRLEEGQRRLEQLRRQDSLARLQARRERAMAADDLQRLLPYRGSGAIAEDTFSEKERALQRLEGQQLAEAQQRSQVIGAEGLALQRQRQELERNRVVVAPLAGCVVEVLVPPGAVVAPGSVLFTLERRDRRGDLMSLAYFPSRDGKRLKAGQPVRITPTTTRAERHGGIRGRILRVRTLPVSREALRQRLGVESLVEAVQPGGAAAEPLIEVVTSLQRDPRSRSGYDWGGGAGPDLVLTAGTGTEVSVLVEGRQPISYVIPLLRDLSGIY
ncbi:MAG: HlyD family efflux transporter periplasmic adaptor subunit [Cyanobacteriota bacterium]|jgi:multidrug efflux pump subunit AcrA (membrane-fusion protein)